MKKGRSNTFNRALGHLKSTEIDEKLHMLSEIPTNNTSGIYFNEPQIVTDNTVNGHLNNLDLDADDSAQNGRDTSGLFMPDGTILTIEPPGDTSYILGPMAAMYYTWSYPWTMIGYIRQSDRKMVNLARVDGKLSDWNGVNGFNSYGQLTLEQAVWFRDTPKQTGASNDPSTYNYYAFYPGPPSANPDPDGRYPCVITGTPKRRDDKVITPEKPQSFNDDPHNHRHDPPDKKKKKKKNEGPNGEPEPELTPDGDKKLERGEPLNIDDFSSAAEFAAFHAGGGNAAMKQKGLTAAEVIAQGNRNLDSYDGGPRTPDYGDYKGPAFGNDTVANRERNKAKQARLDKLYNYWNDNYVDPNPVTNPYGMTNKQLEKMPSGLRQAMTAQDPNNYAGAFKDTPVGKGFNDFMNDPQHGGWRRAVVDAGVDVLAAVAMARGKGVPMTPRGLARGKGFTVGATGVKQSGYQALQGGQSLHKGSKGVLTNPLGQKQVYSSPTVGQRGRSALRPGTGGSRYVKYGSNPLGAQGRGGEAGGVLGSVVPPGARRIGGPEPQAAVSPKTFQKGQRIMQKAYDSKYSKTATAQKIRQRASQAGFGDSPNIDAKDLPTRSAPTKQQTRSRRLGTATGAAAAIGSELVSPQAAEPNVSRDQLNKDISNKLPGYTIGDFDKKGKGDHVSAPILDPQGNPVMDPQTGRPLRVGGGVRGKNEFSNSARAGLTQAINKIKGGAADTSGQAKGSRKVDTKTSKPVTKTGKRSQPAPTKRSTIKTMSRGTQGRTPSATPVQTPGQPKLNYSGPNIDLGTLKGRFRNIRFGDDLSGYLISEQRKRILRNIKKPYVIKEIKQEKLQGYRPRVSGGLNAELDKLMLKAENPASFKPMDETVWTKQDKYYNARLSQERKNEVLDHLGTAGHYWEILTETGRKSHENAFEEMYGDYKVVRKEQLIGDTLLLFADENGNKESMLQSEYQDMIARQFEEPLYEQEKLEAPKDPLVKRIKDKLSKQIDYPDKPAKKGYPNEPPPQMVNGRHPEHGKKSGYYNKLDPISANSMPPTGDPEIDAKVNSQKRPLKLRKKTE